MFKRAYLASAVAEFLGTATLVIVALVLSQTTSVSYFIGTSLAGALIALYMIFGTISGAHLNPAITFGLWVARRISTLRGVVYVAVQLLGGLAALELYQYFTNNAIQAQSLAYSTPMWLAQVVGTGVLAIGLMAAISKGLDTLSSGAMYGLSYFVGILIAATVSAPYLNPAMALGARSWNAVYVLGPLVGGLIGVNLYAMLFSADSRWRLRRK